MDFDNRKVYGDTSITDGLVDKKMNATFEYTDCMCITVSPVREVRALSQRDVGEGRFWVEGDAYKQ